MPVVWVGCRQKGYEGPEKITYFNTPQFEKEVLSAAPRCAWLIEFYCTWSTACLHFSYTYAELSLKCASTLEQTQSSIYLSVDLASALLTNLLLADTPQRPSGSVKLTWIDGLSYVKG